MPELGIALIFVSGFGFGVLLTMAYIGSLGWEKRWVTSSDD